MILTVTALGSTDREPSLVTRC